MLRDCKKKILPIIHKICLQAYNRKTYVYKMCKQIENLVRQLLEF